MIEIPEIRNIIDLYEKHGWIMRRVLNGGGLVPGHDLALGGAEIRNSGIDALWFSRRSMPGSETWELRRISTSPFALLAFIPDSASDSEREEILSDIECEMKQTAPPTGCGEQRQVKNQIIKGVESGTRRLGGEKIVLDRSPRG